MGRRLLLMTLIAWPAVAGAQESPFTGTWRLNPSEKPEVWLLQNGRYRCDSCTPKVDIKADGSDQPIAGAKEAETWAVKAVDDHVVESTTKLNGKVEQQERDVVSADGRTLTTTFTLHPRDGGAPKAGSATYTRQVAGPPGSHAISGTWRLSGVDDETEKLLLMTYKATPEGMTMSRGTGASYDAKFDGKPYPVTNAEGTTLVLEKLDERTVQETHWRDGKVVARFRLSVSPDGKLLTVDWDYVTRGAKGTSTAARQ